MSFRDYPVEAITDIHDGDTLTAHLDLGLDQCHVVRLRLLGVYAAELNTPGGPAARRYIIEWIDAHRGPLTCYTAKTARGHEANTLGRWVGDIHHNQTGESLCVALNAWLANNPTSAGGTGT